MSDKKLDANKEAQRFTSTSNFENYNYKIPDVNELDMFYNYSIPYTEQLNDTVDFCIRKTSSNGKINMSHAKNCLSKLKNYQNYFVSNAHQY